MNIQLKGKSNLTIRSKQKYPSQLFSLNKMNFSHDTSNPMHWRMNNFLTITNRCDLKFVCPYTREQ